jgi:hypothetical protein
MIERHLQHLLDRQARLHGPGQQVADVLAARADHLGAQESGPLPYSPYTRSMPLFCNMTRLRPWFSNETWPIANFGLPGAHSAR